MQIDWLTEWLHVSYLIAHRAWPRGLDYISMHLHHRGLLARDTFVRTSSRFCHDVCRSVCPSNCLSGTVSGQSPRTFTPRTGTPRTITPRTIPPILTPLLLSGDGYFGQLKACQSVFFTFFVLNLYWYLSFCRNSVLLLFIALLWF